MIKNIFVNGVQVNNEKARIQKLGNIASADVRFNDYQRGGASGQMLSKPLFGGMAINMQWFVKGNDLNDFIIQRDRLISYFQNSLSDENYFKTLGFELSNGVIKNIDVIFTAINENLTSENIAHSVFTLSAISEVEFLTSNIEKTSDLILLDMGGMQVPMGVPMDMTNEASQYVLVLKNQGNTVAYPKIKVFGKFIDSFNIINDITNQSMTFDDSLDDLEFVEIDCYHRTAVKGGSANVLGNINGDWLYLAPGTNQLRITSSNSNDTGRAVISFFDSYRNI